MKDIWLGGIILIHDYFSEAYTGVKGAVNDFIKIENKLAFSLLEME